ncbi:MAG: M18 family aminopeptidase [Halioglobus sp.]|nr:M18 family aminopeptidase [Halioglobus sp.]
MNTDDFNTDLSDFLGAATTPFHAVRVLAARLEAAGFRRLLDDEAWELEPGGRFYLTRNDSSLIAFTLATDGSPTDGFRMVGAHTDSPCLMLKPAPELLRQGYWQLGVQVYGGALLNPWFDRDLSLAGRVSYRDASGGLGTALVDFRDPIAVIPSLAIHLDREANKNRSVNAQEHTVPILARGSEEDAPDLNALLLEQIRRENPAAEPSAVLDWELSFYDTQPAARVGLRGEFLASARLDNLLSCYTGLVGLLAADGSANALLVCNDHEEVGSMSASGAQGPFLLSVLRRLGGDEAGFAALVERSMMISADNAHGIHPNYADKHDEKHGPLLNGGPVIKTNANQRYASNSETSGLFRLLAAEENVPVQNFVVRSDMACGSTIGPITAGVTGIRTLDIGVPTFAMHSIRELAGAADAANLARILQRFFAHPGPLLRN